MQGVPMRDTYFLIARIPTSVSIIPKSLTEPLIFRDAGFLAVKPRRASLQHARRPSRPN
jgi:hypothetical protein